MENKTAIEDVSCGDQFETIDHVVVLWVRIRSEKVLHNLQEEEDFRVDEQVVQCWVCVCAKGHHIEIQKDIRYHDDWYHNVEECQKPAIGVQDISKKSKKC